MTLIEAGKKSGDLLEITAFHGHALYQDRLHEMGLRIGSRIVIVGHAPFGGPVLIRYNESFLALRREEAQCLEVQRSHL